MFMKTGNAIAQIVRLEIDPATGDCVLQEVDRDVEIEPLELNIEVPEIEWDDIEVDA
jgi:hypothetical protein